MRAPSARMVNGSGPACEDAVKPGVPPEVGATRLARMAEPGATVAMDERGGGDPLVLVHGLGTNREVWRHVLDPLAAESRVIALDVPGFGDSPPVGPGFDLDEVADGIAGAAEARAGGPFDLIGHSLGGALSLTLAARHPGLVRTLILMAPAGFGPRGQVLAGALGRASEGFLGLRRRVGTPLAASATARRVLLWGSIANGATLDTEDARFMLTASAKATRLRHAVESAVASDLRAALAELPAPVGILWGERDRVVPVAAAKRLRRARPEAPFELIAAAGHVPQLERPEAFLAALGRLRGELARAD